MTLNPTDITRLQILEDQIFHLIKDVSSFVSNLDHQSSRPHLAFRDSQKNLLSYLFLRQRELKAIQLELSHFGLSSLGRSESFVLHNLRQTHSRILDTLMIRQKRACPKRDEALLSGVSWSDAEKILHRHTRDLLGKKPKHRHVSIMVTAPSHKNFSEDWCRSLLHAGCNVLRINTAHESQEEWKQIISILRRVSRRESLPCRILMDLPGPKIRTVLRKSIRLRHGDHLLLGSSPSKSKKSLGCSYPELLSQVLPGHRVLFDDGKAEGLVLEKLGDGDLKIEVIRLSKKDYKLRAEKGINFPDTDLVLDEFPSEDLANLHFAAKYADIVGLSFVQKPSTIQRVRSALSEITRRRIGIVLKIETRLGFVNLPHLLFEAMKGYPVGVMIARGDLGVEIGFERMAEVQEEIMCLCEAAHIPVIWATQVLESSAKTGMPTRSEVTDAATSVRAECVMLNKGPFILQTVAFLDDILRRMEGHTYKRRQIYRPLNVARLFIESLKESPVQK